MKKFLLLFLFMAFKAHAHPHIWVATDLTLLAENSKIVGLGVHWQFDEMYSSAFMLDADLNSDGKLDGAERKIMQGQVMEQAVSRLRPFMLLKFHGLDTKDFNFEDLKITYNQETEKVNYDFKVKLKNPQKLAGSHTLAILDQEYYVGFEQSYDFKVPNSCSFELEEDESMLLYDGLINPETYKLVCK